MGVVAFFEEFQPHVRKRVARADVFEIVFYPLLVKDGLCAGVDEITIIVHRGIDGDREVFGQRRQEVCELVGIEPDFVEEFHCRSLASFTLWLHAGGVFPVSFIDKSAGCN